MSILKKLKPKKGYIPKKTVKEAQAIAIQQKNAAFAMLTGTYVLLQRIMKARDILYIERRNARTNIPERILGKEQDRLVYNVVKAIEDMDNFYRENFLTTHETDEVPILDVVSHYFYNVFSNMEQMAKEDLDLIEKVSTAIVTEDKFIHLEGEQAYYNRLIAVARHGLNLAAKGRKIITKNDIISFI